MSGARLTLTGVADQRRQWQRLPQTLAANSTGPIVGAAESAAADIRAAYPERTGALAAGVRVQRNDRGGLVASATVVNDRPEASWFEHGTQARHTSLGANRGSMPPGHVFVPRMIRWRRAALALVKGVMQREGLTVRDV